MAQKRKHIKVTYSNMSSPDPLLHQYYEEDVAAIKAELGKNYPMYINGTWREGRSTFTKTSPIDTSMVIGHFQQGDAEDVAEAVVAAKAAFPAWRDTPWQERVALLNKAADLISERVFYLAAALSLEVGKNRMEAVGDAEETADLIRYCTQVMTDNNGFIRDLAAESERHHNRSVLKPH
ncbi:MAG: aldehyde dehydrogenase family protein, partial [Anaerolineales bacterium]|nr:aldehyde dehydrogenase family protein [Anaerolineales bacterium]